MSIEQLQTISKLGQFNAALVEAGHFYADKPFSPEQEIGIKIGIAAIATLNEMGIKSNPCILVDDYNAKDQKSPEHLAKAYELGFSPEIIFREKDFVPQAQQMLETLEVTGKTKVRTKTGEKYLKERFIKLTKENGQLTCALLDAALYQDKQSHFGGVCVTVLPDTQDYRTQQECTKQILKALDLKVPILNVYFDPEGKVSVDFNF